MSHLGVNVPNRHLVADDVPRMVGCGFGSFVIFIYDYADVGYWIDRALEIRKAVPDCQIHVRLERRDSLDAHADASLLTQAAFAFGTLVNTLSIRNEPAIESPGVAVAQWHSYLVELGELVKEPTLPARIFAAPMSPGTPDAGAWIEATADAAAGRFAGVWAHCYGDPGEVEADLIVWRLHWPGRLIITECNFGAGRPYDLATYANSIPKILDMAEKYGIESVNLFSWEWSHPDMPLPTSVNVKNTMVETFLKSWRPTPMPNPTTPTFNVGQGVKDLMAQNSDTPQSDEHYVVDDKGKTFKSETFGAKGLYVWSKTSNKTVLLPFR